MKIIFAVQDNNGWESVVSSRFGRADGYICYSEESGKLSFHSNKENVKAGHGAGIQAAQIVLNLHVNSVITGGNIGPKAFQVIDKAGIKMYSHAGTIPVKEALENFKEGKYPELMASDIY